MTQRYIEFQSKGELDAYAAKMRAKYGNQNRATAMRESWKRRKA